MKGASIPFIRPFISLGVVLTMCAVPVSPLAATLEPPGVAAWNVYVSATEARIARELGSSRGFLVSDFTSDAASVRAVVTARQIAVTEMHTTNAAGSRLEGTDSRITHWRGSVFLPGLTLDGLLHRLQHPSERGPHQEDVLALRVLDRGPDRLRLFIRMTRSKIVTVTYDSEHDIGYRRHGLLRASSRSVATRIAEIDDAGTAREYARPPGQDRGFLWRMNSYWRYEQVSGGVIVELESVTLSRSIPLGLGTVVEPIIDRIARESMTRTLDNLRKTHAPSATLVTRS
jgi:hypothetical protein